MSRKNTAGTRVRTVARNTKSGRFAKATSAKRSPSTTVIESVTVQLGDVEVARSASTGRFVKKDTARRHPSKTKVQKLKR